MSLHDDLVAELFREWADACFAVICERSGAIHDDTVSFVAEAKKRAEGLGIARRPDLWPSGIVDFLDVYDQHPSAITTRDD